MCENRNCLPSACAWSARARGFWRDGAPCPGVGEYGHGLTGRVVHVGCCPASGREVCSGCGTASGVLVLDEDRGERYCENCVATGPAPGPYDRAYYG